MRELGVGLVSVGWMGRLHSKAYRALPQVYPGLGVDPVLVHAADTAPESRSYARDVLGYAKTSESLQAVIDDPEVDVVSICAPNFLHAAAGRAAAAAGKPFWIEKPAGRDADETRSLRDAAVEAGIATCVGFNYRHVPAIQLARTMIRGGELGAITNVRGRFFGGFSSDPAEPLSWRFRRELAGTGVLNDLMGHLVDLVHHLLGPISAVTASNGTFIRERADGTGRPRQVENEDLATMLIRFDDDAAAAGAIGSLEASRIAVGPRSEYDIEVFGTRGSLRWYFERLNELQVASGPGGDRLGYTRLYADRRFPDYVRFQPSAGNGMGFDDLKVIEAHHFVSAVTGGPSEGPTIHDALASARVLAAAERSAASGSWVPTGAHPTATTRPPTPPPIGARMNAHEPVAEAPAPGTPFVTAIRRFAELRPDEIVVTDHEGSITRRDLEARTNRLARAYADLGVRADDLVSIGLPNGVPFIEAMIAAWKLGATPQPISHRLPARELAAIIGVAGSSLVVGLDARGVAPSIPEGFEPDPELSAEPLPVVTAARWKAPTSGGSTGMPKIILATQPAVVDALIPLLPLVKMRPGGVKLVTTPLSHNVGVMFSTAPLITGGTLVIAPRFDAESTLRLIARHRVDWTCLVPTMLHRIAKLPAEVREAADLSSLQTIATGGAMCPQWLKEFYVDWVGGDRMVEFYSATESQVIVTADGNEWLSHPGTVGRVKVGELQVRADDGAAQPDGRIGELWVRRGTDVPPPYAYLGATAHRDDMGWETAGDMGWSEDGWLFLADRKADMVVIGGANVYPAEIEGVLEEHPLVLSSCVVGIPDDEYGNVLHAFVQTSDEVTDEELMAFLRERLVPYKMPRTFTRSTVAIRDDAGKVRRTMLRDQAMAAQATND